ncbi:MAG: HipA family kinase [Bacteroidota bacterium]
MIKESIRTLDVTRYLVPLREGGSLPAIVEGQDGYMYVLKFRGAGQGVKALIAELIGGELARALELNVPELVFMNLEEGFAKTEADEEIQDLLKFSVGLNLGMSFLSTALTYDPVASVADSFTASVVVLLDSLLTNIDRTHRNTNLLNWNKELWLIDHGASLYFHHAMNNWEEHAQRGFPMIKDHVLLERATQLDEAASFIWEKLSDPLLDTLISWIPDDWLVEEGSALSPEERRKIYTQFIKIRLSRLEFLKKEAQDAR